MVAAAKKAEVLANAKIQNEDAANKSKGMVEEVQAIDANDDSEETDETLDVSADSLDNLDGCEYVIQLKKPKIDTTEYGQSDRGPMSKMAKIDKS